MTSVEMIAERVVGQYPISIPTSLALEAAFDIYPDRPPLGRKVINEYSEIWINIRTLFRNLMSCFSKEQSRSLFPGMLVLGLLDDIEMIQEVIRSNTNDNVKPIFYYSNYAKLDFHFKHGIIRTDRTDKQLEYTKLHNETIKLLLSKAEKEHIGDIRVFDLLIKPTDRTNALIVTNFAIDLLANKEFSRMTLLESHSGQFKEKAQFYTKFYDGKECSQIPFRKDMLQIFGDNTLFHPMDIKLRREILEVAKKYNWSSITTTDRIRLTIDSIQNPYFKEFIKNILTNS